MSTSEDIPIIKAELIRATLRFWFITKSLKGSAYLSSTELKIYNFIQP